MSTGVYSSEYEDGYEEGYKKGHDEGFDTGEEYGKVAGYSDGFEEGRSNGYDEGIKEKEYECGIEMDNLRSAYSNKILILSEEVRALKMEIYNLRKEKCNNYTNYTN